MKIKDTVERTRQEDTQHYPHSSLSTTFYLYCFIYHTDCPDASKHCDRAIFIII